MTRKKIMPCIRLQDGQAVITEQMDKQYRQADVLADYYGNNNADTVLILDMTSTDDKAHDKCIGAMKDAVRSCDVPVYAGGVVNRFEDIKKYLYTGAKKALVYLNENSNTEALKEGADRFGKDRLIVCIDNSKLLDCELELLEANACALYLLKDCLYKEVSLKTKLPVIMSTEEQKAAVLMKLVSEEQVRALSGSWSEDPDTNLMAFKYACKASGIEVVLAESKISWKEMSLNADGMVPVIVQDYRTSEVLMLAYMNEEAFDETIASGRMTYWSRSRNELWKKGMTSGHFQYVKSLTADCDNDTILAKVAQTGAACHTGNYSCFFKEMLKKEFDDTNPLKVFEDVYSVILDRKEHPKEGSYTNYLFDKGIDKILKKVGEEATEIVIAAKNPDAEEIKYEMSDFLYHAMVLMVERGVTWDDITRELANR